MSRTPARFPALVFPTNGAHDNVVQECRVTRQIAGTMAAEEFIEICWYTVKSLRDSDHFRKGLPRILPIEKELGPWVSNLF